MAFVALNINARQKYNLNSDWSVKVFTSSEDTEKYRMSDTEGWTTVTLPRAFNEDDAFRVSIDSLSEAYAWYVKEFVVPRKMRGGKVIVEFEGVRQAGEFYINGHRLGLHENGVMAVGYDLTPYIKWDEVNELRVHIDNSWNYEERATGTKYQWNNKNFNANYGGIPKNVRLHVTKNKVYQTLPLYSSLGTTGTYVY
ncbi:MAG: beta-galactosidase, partial [Muribaculaceae bacterium]|nr:beta-galactosidase [Muribaculaceae bacterium]